MGLNHTKVDLHIGSRLRQLREASGLSEQGLADQLEITAAQVRMFESGEKRIPPRRLIEAAELFKVNIGYFFEDAPVAAPPQNAALMNQDLMRFLAMPESYALVSAFVAIPDQGRRRGIIDIVKSVSEAPTESH